MKKSNLFRTLMQPFLIGFLLLSIACNSNSSSVDKTVEGKVKPPSMDLIAAVFMGDLNTVKQHVKAGSDLNKKDQYGSTPLHVASTFEKTEIAKVLIEAGADINLTNAEGSTPLHLAAFFCYNEIVKALVEANADKNIRNNFGATALESVSGPLEQARPFYKQIEKDLGVFGVKFDYERLEKTRPEIAILLN